MIRKLICSSLFCLALSAFVLAPSNALAQKPEPFKVSQGTRMAYGGTTINYGLVFSPASLKNYSDTNWSAEMYLSFGYFLIDNLAVIFDTQGHFAFTATANNFASFGPGLFYVFANESPIYPYIQASIRANWIPGGFSPTGPIPQSWALSVGPQVGVLIGFNRHVALDIGAQANVAFPVNGPTRDANISSAIGIIGARISL